MAVITAHASIDTLLFEDLAQIGNGSDFATYSLSGPADSTPDSVEFFHTATPLHIVLHGARQRSCHCRGSSNHHDRHVGRGHPGRSSSL